VDWQIWIADSGKPLPRKYVITTKDDPAQPQYMVLMSNWNVAEANAPVPVHSAAGREKDRVLLVGQVHHVRAVSIRRHPRKTT
jgi:hypothetical protein